MMNPACTRTPRVSAPATVSIDAFRIGGAAAIQNPAYAAI